MSEIETILSKVKKLLSLTVERGATPEEAATAAAKAQALLFEHNLSMAQVKASEPQSKDEEVERIDMEIEGGKGHLTWKRMLLHAVTRNNFCRAVTLSGTADVAVIGKRSNVIVVEYMTEYLEAEILRLAKIEAKKSGDTSQSFIASFAIGAVSTIGQRLKEQNETSTKASASSTALVVQTSAVLDKALKDHFPHTQKSRRASIGNASAFQKGGVAGKTIGLHRPIAGKQPQGMLM